MTPIEIFTNTLHIVDAGLLFGIFYRMGYISEVLKYHEKRIDKLEGVRRNEFLAKA